MLASVASLDSEQAQHSGDTGLQVAAVLVALFEEAGAVRVVLTRRSAGLRRHGSEVAFPGGMLEPGERPRDAALREAYEEIGLDPGAVEVVAELPVTRTASSASEIVPFVGALGARPQFTPNSSEVERVFDVALGHLASESVYRQEIWGLPGHDGGHRMHLFELEDEMIWGATARILVSLLALISGQ